MAEEGATPRQEVVGRIGLIEPLGKWIAVFGSLIAVGQAGTSWITGYWHSKAEEQRADQELRLADVKERSALAAEYLKLIISKDTALPERVTLLDALGAIDRHPLQQWARARYAVYKDALARSEAAFRAQQEAAQAKEGAERDAATLKADIEKLNADIALTPDDAAAREHLHTQIIAKSEELGRINGRLSLAVLRFEATQTTVTQVQQPLASQTILSPVAGQAAVPSQPSADVALADAITAISQKVTASWLSHYFPPAAAANIENAAPFLQAALQEFKVADKRMVAAIIATVAVETPRFEAYEEPASAAAKYDGKLGNTQEGDGIRYRGRGYLGITGRSNYESMSSRLGLGTRLLNSPDDAKSPEVATRILVAWFIDRQDRLIPALAQSDLSQVRWVVVGSRTRDIERFTEVYRKVLTDL